VLRGAAGTGESGFDLGAARERSSAFALEPECGTLSRDSSALRVCAWAGRYVDLRCAVVPELGRSFSIVERVVRSNESA